MLDFLNEETFKNIGLNIFSGLMGALLLYLASNGVSATRRSRELARAKFYKKVEVFTSGQQHEIQELFSDYLISIVKLYLVGNIFWIAQGLLWAVNPAEAWVKGWFGVLYLVLGVAGTVAIILTLAKSLELDRLRRKSRALPV